MKILIISTNALGDTYLSCSALCPLRQQYDEPIIDFVANKDSELFLNQFHLNKIFYLKKKSFSEIIKTIFLIRKERYDLVYSFFPGRVNSFLLIGSNSKIKSGFVNMKKLNEWHTASQKLFLKGMNIASMYHIWNPQMNYLERIIMCLDSTGINVNDINKPKIPLSKTANQNVSSDIVIHFTSSRSYRNIKDSELMNLINHLSNKMNLKVNLIGSEKDFNKIDKFSDNNNVKFISDPSIEILISVLLKTKIFIGVDSFPIHLADAYNIETIGIFGGTRPESVFQSMANKLIIKKKAVNDISCNDILSVFNLAFKT